MLKSDHCDPRPAPRFPLTVDGHLDLASGAVRLDRDLTLDLATLRDRESGWLGDETVAKTRGTAILALPEMRAAGTRLCLSSIIARVKPITQRSGPPGKGDIDFVGPREAEAAAMAQVAWHRAMARDGRMAIVERREQLDAFTGSASDAPLGVVLMLEGCDPIVEPAHASLWFDRGVRVASLAHYGRARYARGTGGDGPLTELGRRLVPALDAAGVALDLTHTADRAIDEALDLHGGAACSTHANCRALCPGDRQLTDDQVKRIAARGGVVGVVPCNPMIVGHEGDGWPERDAVSLEHLADHVDHICQLTGGHDRVAVGTDADGGFGREGVPREVETYADVPRLGEALAARGYADDAIAAAMGGNWLAWLGRALP